jgi:glycosyltransferase involved in cell wall biosynthesis
MSPRFSVITTVFDPEQDHLSACLESVRAQSLDDWEHIVVDDASTRPWVADMLTAASASDPRVRVIRRETNGGMVAAGNEALAAAAGELIGFLDHDDELTPDALATMSAAMTDGIDVAYSDHDVIRPDERYAEPSYKPDFSPERLRSQNYITHFLVARRALVDDVGRLRAGFDGAHDHDLVLRLSERAGGVAHVPRICYHWRQSPRSVSTSSDNKPWAFEAGVRAVADHCERIGIDATVELTDHEGCYRVVRRVTDEPLVSVVVPTRGSSGRVWGATRTYVVDAIRSLIERSTHQNLEFVVVHDAETPASVVHALRRVAGERLVLVEYDKPFNFSEKMNLGVLHASAEMILLLNDDTELIEPTSIEVLVGHLRTPGVAMAGAKLLFADGTLQHGGHVYAHDIGHACFGWSGDLRRGRWLPGRAAAQLQRRRLLAQTACGRAPHRVDAVGVVVPLREPDPSQRSAARGVRVHQPPLALRDQQRSVLQREPRTRPQ